MAETVVLYPAPSFPHLVSMVELGNLILHHQQGLSITILVPSMSSDSSTAASSYINHISQTTVLISFISLPPLHLSHSTLNPPEIVFKSISLNALNALDALQNLSTSFKILAFITSTMDESLKTQIPTYCYFTSSASALAFFLHLPTIHSQATTSFKDIITVLNFPGLPPFPASCVPDPVLNRDSPSYHYFLSFVNCLLQTKGVILNTFNSLEPRAIKAITDGVCVPNDKTPPIFCVGPLISSAKDHSRLSANEGTNCMTWLDKQPRKSVVFLCFRSRGVFSEPQLREIAIGLERSNHRFLWVVNPLGLETEPNLEELLPQGFFKRIKEKGLGLKSWAPQNAVLSHESVGGFVTHCGWNSVLEAVACGVPMIAWPLYAEQRMNGVILVEEMKLAIPMGERSKLELRNDPSEELVSAEEVERRVKQLMEMEDGKILRQRCLELKGMAAAARSDGGFVLHCIFQFSCFLEACMCLLLVLRVHENSIYFFLCPIMK